MSGTAKALWLSVCIAAGGSAMPAIASAGVAVDINVAPPAAPIEVVPGPRAGYEWAPGYWEWRGGAHVWVPGRWLGGRPGFRWAPDHWEQRGPYWHHVRGHWVR